MQLWKHSQGIKPQLSDGGDEYEMDGNDNADDVLCF